ncbi:MAG: phosphate ABC transporter permease subunit PstC [Nitrososphaerales archaeon]|nr:phosphate ABC transporter permease subunit PstC [Nitrososphaerales archaeon]
MNTSRPDSASGRTRLRGDSVLKAAVATAAVAIIGLLLALGYNLYSGSSLTISKFGFSFLPGTTWDPVHEIFGALPFIYGTIVTSLLALLIGLPISLGVAIFLTEKIKGRRTTRYLLGTLIELLAAVPSVIYGLWGLFFLSPLLRQYVETPLSTYLGFIPIFSGTPFGLDFFTAGVILSIMIIPTVTAVSRDILNAVPNSQREAMYSLGGTNWEVTRKSVLPYARSGIFGATILGLGRAVGETMAVTMVIGNTPRITASLFSGGYTLPAVIANEFTEATSPLYLSALVELGLILFVVALAINVFARFLVWRMTHGVRSRVR